MSFGYQVLGFGAFPSRGADAYVPSHAAVFDGSADYLIWTPSHVPASNTKKTISFWTKRTKFASVQWILDVASNGDQIQFTAGDALEVSLNATTDSQLTTTPLFRDITAWQHFVVVFDTNNSTAADRVKVYVNGSRIADADLATSTDPAQGANVDWLKGGIQHNIGRRGNNSQFYSGLLAEFVGIDGLALTPASFGETNSNGVWVPKDPLQGYEGGLAGDKNISDWGGENSVYFNFSDTNDLGKNFRPTAVTANDGTYKIDYSVYFEDSDDLNKPTSSSSTSSNTKRHVIATWIKDSGRTQSGAILIAAGSPAFDRIEYVNAATGNHYLQYTVDGGSSNRVVTFPNTYLRDPTAWRHLVISYDTTQASGNRIIGFMNGVEMSQGTAGNGEPAADATSELLDDAVQIEILSDLSGASANPRGIRIADFIALDGQSIQNGDVSITNFGGWDANGIWMPKDPTAQSFTFGNNGFLLQFKGDGGSFDANADAGGVGADTSGEGHHLASSGDVHLNRTTDSPTNTSGDNEGNYATINPLAVNVASNNDVTLSEGNTKLVYVADHAAEMTIARLRTGKWYWELKNTTNQSGSTGVIQGSYYATLDRSANLNSTGIYYYNPYSGLKMKDGSGTSYGSATSTNDILQVALDLDNNKIWWGINNTWQASGDPAAGTNAAYTDLTDTDYTPVVGYGAAYTSILNTGQTALAYTPPTGFKLLNTANLTAPTYTDARKYFAPVLYEGTGSALSVRGCYDSTGTAWTPDFVWIKNRDQTDDHRIFDTVRGEADYLEANSDVAASQGNHLPAMLSDFIPGGFRVGNNVSVNTVDESYVAFCWRAGGQPTVDNDNTSGAMDDGSVFKGGTVQTSYTPSGSPDIYPRKMSIAEHGGFSIVEYVGNGTDDQDVPHGLDTSHPDGGKPGFILIKRTETTANWVVGHDGLDVNSDGAPWTDFMNFDVNAQAYDGDTVWSDEAPSSTVFTLGNGGGVNANTGVYIAYLFQRVPGLIGIGKYTGNGNVNGPYVVIDDGAQGFRPAWIMEKRTDAAGAWYITDVARNTSNPINFSFLAEGNNADVTGTTSSGAFLDATANGYKIRGTSTGQEYNINNGKYIYVAFADQPFQLQGRAR